MASQQLMKLSGDIKALSYRDMLEFASTLGKTIERNSAEQVQALAGALIAAAEQLNPDLDAKGKPLKLFNTEGGY